MLFKSYNFVCDKHSLSYYNFIVSKAEFRRPNWDLRFTYSYPKAERITSRNYAKSNT
jgi:hypothetical protein